MKLKLSIFFMEGAEQESLHQSIRVSNEVIASRWNNKELFNMQEAQMGHPRGLCQGP